MPEIGECKAIIVAIVPVVEAYLRFHASDTSVVRATDC